MTDADRIAAKFQAARPVFAEKFHADTYAITRRARVPDGSGGYTETDEVVESLTVGGDFPYRGRCSLDVARFRGSERTAGADVVTSIATYTVELPIASVLTAADTLVINGRAFNVIDVKRGGEMGLFTEATVEERS